MESFNFLAEDHRWVPFSCLPFSHSIIMEQGTKLAVFIFALPTLGTVLTIDVGTLE
jgi:hypothetical protein